MGDHERTHRSAGPPATIDEARARYRATAGRFERADTAAFVVIVLGVIAGLATLAIVGPVAVATADGWPGVPVVLFVAGAVLGWLARRVPAVQRVSDAMLEDAALPEADAERWSAVQAATVADERRNAARLALVRIATVASVGCFAAALGLALWR